MALICIYDTKYKIKVYQRRIINEGGVACQYYDVN